MIKKKEPANVEEDEEYENDSYDRIGRIAGEMHVVQINDLKTYSTLHSAVKEKV